MVKTATDEVEAPTTDEDEKEKRKAALRKAYGQATQDLREAHTDEFNVFYAKRAEALGYEWHPRQTAEQRAAEEFDRLLSEFPFLRDRLPTDGAAAAETES